MNRSLRKWAERNIPELCNLNASEIDQFVDENQLLPDWLRTIMVTLIVTTLILVFFSFDLYSILRNQYGEWGFAVAVVLGGLSGAFVGLPLDFIERKKLRTLASKLPLK